MDEWPWRAELARRRLAARYAEEGRPYPAFCAALVVARGERGLSIEEMAAELGCGPALLEALERGLISPAAAPESVRAFVAASVGRSPARRPVADDDWVDLGEPLGVVEIPAPVDPFADMAALAEALDVDLAPGEAPGPDWREPVPAAPPRALGFLAFRRPEGDAAGEAAEAAGPGPTAGAQPVDELARRRAARRGRKGRGPTGGRWGGGPGDEPPVAGG